MKYQLIIKMIGCGSELLNEIRSDMETALNDTNIEKKFPDGGWAKVHTCIGTGEVMYKFEGSCNKIINS